MTLAKSFDIARVKTVPQELKPGVNMLARTHKMMRASFFFLRLLLIKLMLNVRMVVCLHLLDGAPKLSQLDVPERIQMLSEQE